MAVEKKPKEKKEKPAEKAKPETKAEGPVETKTEAPAETKSDAPKNYSRGEGQKVVTQAYKDNWNAIYGKKKR